MKNLQIFVLCLLSKLALKVIALAYNPNQAIIIQLLWDIYEIAYTCFSNLLFF